MRINNAVIKPIVTEKSYAMASKGFYTFKVSRSASKGAIKNNIKSLYGVDVIEVNTNVLPGKPKRIMKSRKFTKTETWKKAVVRLKEGQSIDVFPKE